MQKERLFKQYRRGTGRLAITKRTSYWLQIKSTAKEIFQHYFDVWSALFWWSRNWNWWEGIHKELSSFSRAAFHGKHYGQPRLFRLIQRWFNHTKILKLPVRRLTVLQPLAVTVSALVVHLLSPSGCNKKSLQARSSRKYMTLLEQKLSLLLVLLSGKSDSRSPPL